MDGFAIDFASGFIEYRKVGVELINFARGEIVYPEPINFDGPVFRNLRSGPRSGIGNIIDGECFAARNEFLGDETCGGSDDAAQHNQDHAAMDNDGSKTSGKTFSGVELVAVLDDFVFVLGEKLGEGSDRRLVQFGAEGKFLELFGRGVELLSAGKPLEGRELTFEGAGGERCAKQNQERKVPPSAIDMIETCNEHYFPAQEAEEGGMFGVVGLVKRGGLALFDDGS